MLQHHKTLTLHQMDEAAKRQKLRFDLDAKEGRGSKNREKLCLELETKQDTFFARLAVAKLEEPKREANANAVNAKTKKY